VARLAGTDRRGARNAALGVDQGVLIAHLYELVARQLEELSQERFDLGVD
jgi:hypothetical protein